MIDGRAEADPTRHQPRGLPGPANRISQEGLERQASKDISHRGVEGIRGSRPVYWMHAVPPALTTLPINAEPGAAARAILSEIRMSAERLCAQGEPHSIDLRFLKSMPDERATLVGLLGYGEVSAIVDSAGRSEIHETAIPCVWWISHLNSDNETVGELIEISAIPELLVGDVQAITPALEALRARESSGAY